MKRSIFTILAVAVALSPLGAKDLPLKVLYLGLSKGFAHSSVGPAGKTIEALGTKTGLWTTKISSDIGDLAPDKIKQWDAILFFTTGDLGFPAETKQAFLDWVAAGGGFAGFHSATDTYYNWPEYGELIGGYFNGHPWNQKVRFKVEDPDHPAVADLAPSFEFVEEIYVFRNFDKSKVHVLMSLDDSSVDASRGAYAQPTLYFANAWTSEHGKGRVMYSGLGHHDEAWADPQMHAHIIGTIKWLARLDWQSDPKIQAAVKANDVAALAAMVKTAPEALRGEPVRALGAVASQAAVKALQGFAAPDQPLDLRLAALNGLGRAAAVKAAALNSYLDDDAPEVRKAAIAAISRKGAEGEVALLAALKHTRADVRQAALGVLAGIDTPTITDALLQMVKSDDEATVRMALTGLMGRKDDRIAAVLLDALQHPTGPAKALLGTVIDRLAPMAGKDEVYTALKVLLTSPDAGVRAAAARAVAGSGKAEAAPLVAPLIFDANNDVANAAMEALGKLPNADLKGYVTPWAKDFLVVGPFTRDRDKDFGPEAGLKADAVYPGLDGDAKWQKAKAGDDGLLNFRPLFKTQEGAVAYAWTVVHAPRDMEVQMRLGSDDGVKVWLNGEVVHKVASDRGLQRDGDRVNVKLKAGDNVLLAKVDQGGGDWSLTLRFGSPTGGLDGVTFAAPTP